LKKLGYTIYILVITLVILEVAIRIFSSPNPANVELFLNKKHHYLLPLPTDSGSYYQESITAVNKEDKYRVFEDTLGWSHSAWGWDTNKFPCYANDRGMRITQNQFQNLDSAKKKYKILAIGNSFTHGDAVIADETWVYKLGQKLDVSIGNLGVGGYGIQQALLRLMTSNIEADTVLFGVIWGDFERALEPVYTFYQGGNKTRPILEFKEGTKHKWVNVPVMTPREFYDSKQYHNAEIYNHIQGFDENVFSNAFWTNSYSLRLLKSTLHQKANLDVKPIYISDDERLEYCMNIFQLFDEYCRAKKMYCKVILLDTGQNFWHQEKWELDNPWSLVKTKLKERNIAYLEYHEELSKAINSDRENLIHPDENLHYSNAGNTLVAELLYKSLTTQ
jgi:hypothetical protein